MINKLIPCENCILLPICINKIDIPSIQRDELINILNIDIYSIGFGFYIERINVLFCNVRMDCKIFINFIDHIRGMKDAEQKLVFNSLLKLYKLQIT